jgi:hypothetical protein
MSFVGPAYTLVNRKAALDDSVNLYLAIMEAGGKSKATMESAPGYAQIAAPGIEVRGCFTTNDRTFWAIDDTLFEQMDAAGTLVSRGTLATSSGYVEFEYGTTQLVLVDGGNGYVLTLATNIFTQIGSDAFYGAARIAFLDNFFLFPRPDTGQFIKTALNDATSFDALDYATAESSPDDLVCPVVVQKRLLLFGQKTTEFWRDAGSADFPFEPGGGVMEVGCLAIHSPRVIDNTVFWLGGVGASGPGSVYRLNGYNAERVSTDAVDQALQASTDITAATAYAYQDKGFAFYAINAPGLDGTWVYNIKAGTWDRRCDTDSFGQFTVDRVVCHTYNFGQHFVGGSDGKIYRMASDLYMKGSDPLIRQRTSPHSATPSLLRLFFNRFTLDCTTGSSLGAATFVELSWLDWGIGSKWSNWSRRSLGAVGQRFPRVQWFLNALGSGVDRVWRVRYTGNTPFSIINVEIDATEGQT